MTPYRIAPIISAVLFFSTLCVQAAMRLPKIIASNMVLQQKQSLPVWGWDTPGQAVTVGFGGVLRKAIADGSGYWKVVLPAMKASGKPADMRITGSETITLSNILVGEVWLCSGQSNMEYKMKDTFAKPLRSVDSTALELSVYYPSIRLFKVEKVLSTPDVTTAGWNECKGKALENASAIGYYFARNIHRELNVPIGVIMSSWGGSRIEAWTSEKMYAALPAFKEALSKQPVMITDFAPGKYYASMIEPLVPFALKGFLWYQGEANCLVDDGMFYADKMQALVEGWRNVWGNTVNALPFHVSPKSSLPYAGRMFDRNAMPFYSVEIAPFYYSRRNTKLPHQGETLPELWEAQLASLQIPKTDMVVTTDLVDNLADIHPSYKWEVARRLTNIALTRDYNKKGIETSGPRYTKMTVKNGKATLRFSHAEGMKSGDGKPVSWFSVAGKDGKFEPAEAVIKGNKLIISNPSVPEPQAVRFAWSETAQPNLVNAAGLPAVPFRTDSKKWKPGF